MYCEYTNSYLLFSISFNMKCVLQLLLLIFSSRLIMVLFIRQSFCFHDKKLKEFLLNIVLCYKFVQGYSLVQYHYIPNTPLLLLQDLQNAFEDALERYNNIHG